MTQEYLIWTKNLGIKIANKYISEIDYKIARLLKEKDKQLKEIEFFESEISRLEGSK